MKKLFLLLCFVSYITVLPAQDVKVKGTWNGVLDMGVVKMNLVFHIDQIDEDYKATMDSPDQGALGIPLSDISFTDDKLSFGSSAMKMTYEGTFANDSIIGTFTQMGHNFPLTLKRGNVELPKRPQEPKPPFTYNSEDVILIIRRLV